MPGKFIRPILIAIVIKPCPGKTSIAIPAINRTKPMQFLIIIKDITSTGWCCLAPFQMVLGVLKKSLGKRMIIHGIIMRLMTKVHTDKMAQYCKSSL